MIFISHAHADKQIVEPIALKLEEVFGRENIFYDSWSIQPGEGLIERIDQGLNDCELFFYFVSSNSLTREMVKLEWQNALVAETKGKTSFIAVRLNDCEIPPILLNKKFIDIYVNGFDVGVRQIIDVILGNDTFRPQFQKFENLKAHLRADTDESIIIEFHAEYFMEPQSRFLIEVANDENEVKFEAVGESSFESGFFKKGSVFPVDQVDNTILMARDTLTSPGFPFIIKLTSTTSEKLQIKRIFKATGRNQFEVIPLLKAG